jgi:hypothetical protein
MYIHPDPAFNATQRNPILESPSLCHMELQFQAMPFGSRQVTVTLVHVSVVVDSGREV